MDTASNKTWLVARTGRVLRSALCDQYEYSREIDCGRPLGIAFDYEGNLLVCETYSGVFRIRASELYREGGELAALDPVVLANDVPGGINFVNTVVQTDADTLVFSDSDSNYNRRDVVTAVFDGRSTGRVLMKKKGQPVKIVASGLAFANGLLLHSANSVLVAETFSWRILKIHLPTGNTSLFAELPCYPDNLSYMDGQIAVGCGGGWRTRPLEILQSSVFLRKLLLTFFSPVQLLSKVGKEEEFPEFF